MIRSSLIRKLQKVLNVTPVEVGRYVSPGSVVTRSKILRTIWKSKGTCASASITATTTTGNRNLSAGASTGNLSYDSSTGFQSGSGSRSSRSQSQPPWMLVPLLPAAFFGLWRTEEDEMSVEDKILMDIKRAILSIKKDKIENAEKYLTRALTKSQEEKLEHAISQILDIQANLALQKRELARAEHLLKLTAQRLVGIQGYGQNDNAIVEMSIKLAQIYEKTGHIGNAISGYEYCIKAQKEKIQSNEVEEALMVDTLLLLAWASHSLGQLHMKLALSPGVEQEDSNQHIATATQLSTEAYRYATEAEGPESEHAITIQSDLATIRALCGDIDGALKTFHEVEIIAKEKQPELYPNISVNIGNLYIQKGSYDKAEQICQEAKLFAGKIHDMEAFARAQECVVKCAKLRKKESSDSSGIENKEQEQNLNFA